MLSLGHTPRSSFDRELREAGGGDVQAVQAEGLVENGDRAPQTTHELGALAITEYPLVLVEWHDAWFDVDQAGPDDCRPDYLVRTVGFLVAEGPRFLSIAHELLPDEDGFRAVTHIPLAIVEGVTRLFPQSG
jgi:hypothetical protein